VTTPEQLDEVFEWLARCAAVSDGVTSVNATRARAYIDKLTHEHRQMRTRHDRAMSVLTWALTALGFTAAERDFANAALVRALQREVARDEPVEQLGQPPIVPSPRRRTP